MTTQSDVIRSVTNRLKSRWVGDLTGEGATDSWPHRFPTGLDSASQDDLQARWEDVYEPVVRMWEDWAAEYRLRLVDKPRRVWSLIKDLPTHVEIESVDQAAGFVAGEWPARLARARRRLDMLNERFPECDRGAVIRATDGYADLDFDLLLTVSDWYLEDPTRAALGITPRQVPLPGVHAKWLQTHKTGVQAVSGLPGLGLLKRHPARIHFTYLDPTYRTSGARIHDSATVGDAFTPAYAPEIVIISENKDTAIHFPLLAGGISVEGVGKGGKTPASFPWLRDAPVVVYWGDIDRDGYEILNGYRMDFDRDIDSVLMDPATYAAYEPFGTNDDKNGNLLTAGTPKCAGELHDDESAMYVRLLDPAHDGHRRVEQERIPLNVALEAVFQLVKSAAPRIM